MHRETYLIDNGVSAAENSRLGAPVCGAGSIQDEVYFVDKCVPPSSNAEFQVRLGSWLQCGIYISEVLLRILRKDSYDLDNDGEARSTDRDSRVDEMLARVFVG